MTIYEKMLPRQADDKPAPPLTADESAMYAECRTLIGSALRKNGISPSPNETQWLGAELADFVLGKMRGTEKPSAPTSPEPTPGFKAA